VSLAAHAPHRPVLGRVAGVDEWWRHVRLSFLLRLRLLLWPALCGKCHGAATNGRASNCRQLVGAPHEARARVGDRHEVHEQRRVRFGAVAVATGWRAILPTVRATTGARANVIEAGGRAATIDTRIAHQDRAPIGFSGKRVSSEASEHRSRQAGRIPHPAPLRLVRRYAALSSETAALHRVVASLPSAQRLRSNSREATMVSDRIPGITRARRSLT
jgi:hypothetical protein